MSHGARNKKLEKSLIMIYHSILALTGIVLFPIYYLGKGAEWCMDVIREHSENNWMKFYKRHKLL